jgi:dTDP-4-dehydrorhamnose reductase
MRILLAGGQGQLAREFQRMLPAAGHEVHAPSEDVFDITDAGRIMDVFKNVRPEAVINCAAYNHVDKAEDDYEQACRVNALGPKNLAIACREHKAFFVHYSTDYVFDGSKEGLYNEEDSPCPINKYGESKLAGERFIPGELQAFLLFRTSWVYGNGGQNFLWKLQEWAAKQQVLKVVTDQVSVPTYTADIAGATMSALDKGLSGLYHLVNGGYATRYEVARYFLSRLGSGSLVLPVTTDTFPGPARRPYFSAMSSRRLGAALGQELPAWEDAVDRYVKSFNMTETAR